MYIGLIDQDALLYPRKFFPNLEIMKLSSYYKKQKDIVDFIFDMRDIDKYSKIYLRKDIQDNIYSSFTLMNPKCSYGGEIFTGKNSYIPMNDEIESVIPDINIYNSYFRKIKPRIKTNVNEKILYNSSFIRFYYNNIFTINFASRAIDARAGRMSNIYIYDKNFFKTKEAIEYFLNEERLKEKVKFLNLQKINDFDLIKKLLKKQNIVNFDKRYSLVYDKYMSNKEFLEVCEELKNYKQRIAIAICKNKNNIYSSINFFKEELKNSLSRILHAKINGIKVYFYFDKNFPEEFQNYQQVFTGLVNWYNQRMTALSFAEYYYSNFPRKKEILQQLSNKDKYLKELININPQKIISKGGKWSL